MFIFGDMVAPNYFSIVKAFSNKAFAKNGFFISVYLCFKYEIIGKIYIVNKADTEPKYPANTPIYGYNTANKNGRRIIQLFIVIFNFITG